MVQLTPFMGGTLIDFNFDAPQIKIVPTGAIIPIIPGVLWMEGVYPGSGSSGFRELSEAVFLIR